MRRREHIFDEYAGDIPNLTKLRENGVWGPLESIVPPITVPAWMCMMTSKDPGTLGIYGFRNRKDHTYDGLSFATSWAIKEPTVWDILSKEGKDSIVMSVPPSYPPKELKGVQIGCFLTPNDEADYTYPKELKAELKENVGEYIFDIRNFRTDNTQYILDESYKMTEAAVQERGLPIGEQAVGLLHDGRDGSRPAESRDLVVHRSRPPSLRAGQSVPGVVARLLPLSGREDRRTSNESTRTTARRFSSCPTTAPRRWSAGSASTSGSHNEGYLDFEDEMPDEITPINKMKIDWSKTKAWGDGGYYGRLFLNVEGREPNGIIPQAEYEKVRQELIDKIESMVDHEGVPLGNKALKPEEHVQPRTTASPPTSS